jgi:hypothetical protein
MNHPTPEEWMSYLYAETNSKDKAGLTAHLRECDACASRLDQWRSAANHLDGWQIKPRTARSSAAGVPGLLARPVAQWAAAGLILLGGFLAGRLGSTVDARKLRAQIEPEIHRQMINEIEARRQADNRAFAAALQKLNSQRIADYVSLKKELDTVAVLTDAGLRYTERELAQLANYTQSTTLPDTFQR